MVITHDESGIENKSVAHIDPDELWSRICKGEQEALASLFYKYYGLLFNYGCKLVAHRELVKDSIQELFLTVWEYHESVNEANSVKSYLLCSLRRELFKRLRKQENRYERNRTFIETMQAEFFNTEELLIHFETKKEHRKDLKEAIEKLSRKQKEAIYLKFYEGLTSSEIAMVMEINKQSVYNHISVAINKLQKFICP